MAGLWSLASESVAGPILQNFRPPLAQFKPLKKPSTSIFYYQTVSCCSNRGLYNENSEMTVPAHGTRDRFGAVRSDRLPLQHAAPCTAAHPASRSALRQPLYALPRHRCASRPMPTWLMEAFRCALSRHRRDAPPHVLSSADLMHNGMKHKRNEVI